MKLGIIRCMQTEDTCPGTGDFKAAREKTGGFEGVEEEIEVIGFISCGGCCGKKAVSRAAEMVKRGATAIAFATCMSKGVFPCPFEQKIKDAVKAKLGDGIRYFDRTH